MSTQMIEEGSIVEYIGQISEYYNSLATVIAQHSNAYTIQFRETEEQERVDATEIQKV